MIGELEKGRPRPTLYKDEEKEGAVEPRDREEACCRVGKNKPEATERRAAAGMADEAEMLMLLALCSIPRDQARPTSCPIGFIARRVQPARKRKLQGRLDFFKTGRFEAGRGRFL
ncbi:hypothetical protein CPLU01_06539 [Colletotrichum plurivorum]|uniref:Uncharacterized protein n=1 Tax=Colletotrichum plurivorum TaxID=2175906 RepID=A0A8H6KHS3_9PEZI|nr:hypothetical protein CPLU01_06539 [Colletotrichum plurivorum]